jgi:hypothetical protein
VILLPHSTKNWDYRHTLPHLAVFRAFWNVLDRQNQTQFYKRKSNNYNK